MRDINLLLVKEFRMLITISFKNGIGSQDERDFNLSQEEYLRLRCDYESYLKEGNPKEGKYLCHNQDENGQFLSPDGVVIHFDSVALVDVKVQLNRIQEIVRKVEAAKLKIYEEKK